MEYNFSGWEQGRRLIEYHVNTSKAAQSLIIDAGANIGAAAVFFHLFVENALVFSIEPNLENFRLLEMNTSQFANSKNYHGAVAATDGELALYDPGSGDMDFRTREFVEGETCNKVKSISVPTIMADRTLGNLAPLIAKIDIEGAEAELFSANTDWIDKFPLIIIEMHDWLLPFSGCSRNFLKAIANLDLDLLIRGENLFLFNKRLLSRS